MANNPGTPLEDICLYGLIGAEVKQTGDFETAIDKMENLLSEYPNSCWNPLGRDNIELWERFQSSEDRLKLEPEDYASHVQLGYTLLRNRYFIKAEVHFLIATADTASDGAYMGLGYTYLNSGHIDEAITAFGKFLETSPDNGNVHNQIGYAYVGQGQFEAALKCFERYLELEPDNPNSHDSYAECLDNDPNGFQSANAREQLQALKK